MQGTFQKHQPSVFSGFQSGGQRAELKTLLNTVTMISILYQMQGGQISSHLVVNNQILVRNLFPFENNPVFCPLVDTNL